jgi:nicotinamidase/pyrazinamidase
MPEALLIIDVQHDFLPPNGALAVPDGDQVIEPINELAHDPRFALVIATRDWHPPDHSSFAGHDGPWPEHCVRDTPGAQLDERLARDAIDVVIDKGTARERAGYSGFENAQLRDLLRREHVDSVTIAGLATDFCVKATAEDALHEGLTVNLVTAGLRGIDPEASAAALRELSAAGAHVR